MTHQEILDLMVDLNSIADVENNEYGEMIFNLAAILRYHPYIDDDVLPVLLQWAKDINDEYDYSE